MADRTTGELPAVKVGSLPLAPDIFDETKIPVEQQSEARHITGAQWKAYATAAVDEQVGIAQSAAEKATQQAGAAEKSAQEAAGSAESASESLAALNNQVELAEAARDRAETAASGAESSETAAGQSARDAAESEANAEASAGEAKQSATEAAQSATEAGTAKDGAVEAQEAAETARDKAQAASTTATEQATAAAESADTAKQYSGNPPRISDNSTWEIWDAELGDYQDTGKKAVATWDKSYPSIAEMEADAANQPVNAIAIISSDVEETDNARLYIKRSDGAWHYLADLSGMQGVGVESFEQTEGDHAPGTTDTYTMTLTDGRQITVPVYNGANGEGTGDMEAVVYDPEGKAQDVFKYVDDAVGNVTIEMDEVPTDGSENAVKSGGVFEALGKKQDTLSGTQGQVVGFDAKGKAVAQDAPESGVNDGTASNITGLIKGDGETVSAALAGVDYVTPSGSITGNAGTADKLKTPRKINITGGATGSASFDGADDVTIDVTVNAEGGGIAVQAEAPENHKLGWVDTSMGGVLKYWNEDSGAWEPTKAVWG